MSLLGALLFSVSKRTDALSTVPTPRLHDLAVAAPTTESASDRIIKNGESKMNPRSTAGELKAVRSDLLSIPKDDRRFSDAQALLKRVDAYLAVEDEAAKAGNGSAATPSTAPGTPSPVHDSAQRHAAQWQYERQSDEMGRGVSKLARVTSTNRLSFGSPYQGGQYVELTVRNSPKHDKDVYLWIEHGQFHCSGIDGCTVSVRFDDGPIQTFTGRDASDGDSRVLFIKPYQRFITGLRKAKNLRIEAEFFREGVRVVEFDVAGLNPP